jgi:hypothetical protein
MPAFIYKYSHVIALVVFTASAFSQKLVKDSLLLEIQEPPAQLVAIQIDTILDNREYSHPRLVAIDEVTKYCFIPVDLYIMTEKPLVPLIKDLFYTPSPGSGTSLVLGIKHFRLKQNSVWMFFKNYQLNAVVTISVVSNNSTRSIEGELIFESEIRRFFAGSTIKRGYESVIQKWLIDLPPAILSADSFLNSNRTQPPDFFRYSSLHSLWMQLNMQTDFVLTGDGLIINGQIFFSCPEAGRRSLQSRGLLRYRHQKKFSSIEWGLLNSTVNYRLDADLLCEIRAHLLLGVNRWKDMKTESHLLYDALISDLSFQQSIYYHPRYARTLIFGAGLYEGLTYIYSQGFHVQTGIMLNFGLKL